MGVEEVVNLGVEKGVVMPEIFTANHENKDQHNREADHEKRGRDDLDIEAPSREELGHEKDEESKQRYEKSVSGKVEQSELSEQNVVEFNIDIQIQNEQRQKAAEEQACDGRIDKGFQEFHARKK